MKYLNVKEMQLKYIKINFIEVYRKFLHSLLIKFFFFQSICLLMAYWNSSAIIFVASRQWNCRKVMFSVVSVCLSVCLSVCPSVSSHWGSICDQYPRSIGPQCTWTPPPPPVQPSGMLSCFMCNQSRCHPDILNNCWDTPLYFQHLSSYWCPQ